MSAWAKAGATPTGGREKRVVEAAAGQRHGVLLSTGRQRRSGVGLSAYDRGELRLQRFDLGRQLDRWEQLGALGDNGRDGLGLLRREPASADVVEQVGIGEGAVLWRLQRPDVERHRRAAAGGDDAINQELGGRHVAVLRGGCQHRLEHRFHAFRRKRVKACPVRAM